MTRRNDADNALWTQQEAEVIALQEGDKEEAARRRHAAIHLKAKQRRSEVKPIAFHLIRELGPRDAIGYMLKERFLEERHGRTALMLRTYELPAPKSPNLERVEHSGGSGLESMVDARLRLARAKTAAQLTLPSQEYLKPVHGLVCGTISILQAGRLVNGNKDRGKKLVKDALRAYLEAAEPFFGKVA
ncbi:MAG: hypothetical protein AAFO74_12965 [Pseudomonadota bacterium]